MISLQIPDPPQDAQEETEAAAISTTCLLTISRAQDRILLGKSNVPFVSFESPYSTGNARIPDQGPGVG